ncbi:hypothetical protein [Streptomyces sp. NPDC058295]
MTLSFQGWRSLFGRTGFPVDFLRTRRPALLTRIRDALIPI